MRNILIIIGIFLSISVVKAEIKIVTTLSSYSSIAKSIGGDLVSVTSIASPRFNPHFIEPKPSDIFKIKKTDLFIHSGLDLEAWREPLIDAAARAEVRSGGDKELDLSKRISLLQVPAGQVSRSEGDIHQFGNPHYWLDPRNGEIIAQDIASKLKSLDPVNAKVYDNNLNFFLKSLDSKMKEWGKNLASFKSEEIIGYHNEWVYLTNFMQLTIDKYVESKPGVPPTPQHLEELEKYIASKKIKVLIQATFYPKDALDFLRTRTGINTVTLCQNVEELKECSDYISMIDYNIDQIIQAFHD